MVARQDITTPPSTSSINTYEQLLIYFLRSNFSTIEKNALNSNARKIWNQKKAREEAKDSKQYNFILRNETIKKLDELAKKYYLSRSEIIESIIESEYKNRVHIEEKINRRKQIKHPSSD
jgi:allophanate hydrolase subunit 1